MTTLRSQAGFSIVEILVAATLLLLVFVAVLGLLDQAQFLSSRSDSQSRIQGNVRLAADRLERDLRMVGFGVPSGEVVGGSTIWVPAVFHAAATEIGYRADADDGAAAITCTPSASNTDCPVNELLLESTTYYDALSCEQPDSPGTDLPLVIVNDRTAWQAATCSGVDVPNSSIDISGVTTDTFAAGLSDVHTIEQVYYRYVPGSQPPYGRLERSVRYGNAPNDSFPPASPTWGVVAENLTDFWLEYRDAAGAVISGNPLSSAQRAQVRRIVFFLEGFDSVGPQGATQLIQVESEVLVRNAAL
jgi:hypothetical protein